MPILKEEKKMKRIIDEEGKPSITHYQLIQSYDNYSLVKCSSLLSYMIAIGMFFDIERQNNLVKSTQH